MIRRLIDAVRYLIRRERWVGHPEDGTWHKGHALIELTNDSRYRLHRRSRSPAIFDTLREAIEAEAEQ